MLRRQISQIKRLLIPLIIAVLIVIAWVSITAMPAQTTPVEKHIPVTGKAFVTVTGTDDVSIKQWDKPEISIVASTATDQVNENEIQIEQKKDKIEIICKPAKPNKVISITLQIPKKTVVTHQVYDTKIEIKEPVEQTSIHCSNANIELHVPPASKIDFRNVRSAMWFSPAGPNGYSGIRVAKLLVGQGPPYIKIDKTVASVGVNRPQNSQLIGGAVAESEQRQLTTAAKTMALRGGTMGESVRKSDPRFANLNDDLTADKGTGDEAGDLTLRSELVNLNVSVTDNKGRPIPGLTKEDFSIYEDDVQQSISHFSPEQMPFNLVLLLDMSGSVASQKALIIDAALHFIDVVSPQDKVAVITFTDDVVVVSHLTQNRDSLRDSIKHQVFPIGGTAFYDALGYTLTEELRSVHGQRNAVVILSDGEDNALMSSISAQTRNEKSKANNRFLFPSPSLVHGSFLQFDDLLNGVRESDALIYPIHLDSDNPYSVLSASIGKFNDKKSSGQPKAQIKGLDEMIDLFAKVTASAKTQLQELADASGGRVYNAHRIEDLKQVYDQVAAELRAVYSLAYAPGNLSADDTLRLTNVKVNRPDSVARTRHGYYMKKPH